MIQKLEKKQTKQKLQKKLELRQLTLEEILQEDIALDWFKQSNPAFLAMLTPEGMKQLINYIVFVGPPQNKMRSFKIPMIATQILSTPMPKVFQLMFMEDKSARGEVVAGWLIQYFWRQQNNYVISGYVIKILNNLMAGNAHKVLQFLIKNVCPKMLKFLQSHSIAQFLLRILIVQDILLNAFIKQRLELFNQIISIYSTNTEDSQILSNINYMICESFTRLWSQKHKELGRYASCLFRIVQIIIDYDDKFQQQKILVIVLKLLVTYTNQAPYLIMAIYKKIFKRLNNMEQAKVKTQSKISVSKFSLKNLCLLQSLEYIFSHYSQIYVKLLAKQNIFPILYEFVARYQWNSLVLNQIQKIIKHSIAKKNDSIYDAMIPKLISFIALWKKQQNTKGKFGRGYTGFLNSLLQYLKHCLKQNKEFKQYLIKNCKLAELERFIPEDEIITSECYKVVHDIAKPIYKATAADVVAHYKSFFEETQSINRKYQLQNPADHIKHKQDDVLIHQIENENELVYKLLTQIVVGEDSQKKNQDNIE